MATETKDRSISVNSSMSLSLFTGSQITTVISHFQRPSPSFSIHMGIWLYPSRGRTCITLPSDLVWPCDFWPTKHEKMTWNFWAQALRGLAVSLASFLEARRRVEVSLSWLHCAVRKLKAAAGGGGQCRGGGLWRKNAQPASTCFSHPSWCARGTFETTTFWDNCLHSNRKLKQGPVWVFTIRDQR